MRTSGEHCQRDRLPRARQGLRGRRRTRDASGLGRRLAAIRHEQAQGEAAAAFGCGDVYLEKYVERPATWKSR